MIKLDAGQARLSGPGTEAAQAYICRQRLTALSIRYGVEGPGRLKLGMRTG